MDENYLNILRTLTSNSNISQRKIARELNLSLGKANYIINALIEKGYVKVRRFKNSNNKRAYTYYLTADGIKKKIELTYQFFKTKSKEFEQLRQEILALEQDIKASNLPPDTR
jgi:EPS-associated MarR family transcriptional regulator